MAAASRPAWITPLAICCLLATLFFIAATIVIALIPIYLPSKSFIIDNNQPQETLAAAYASNAVGARSDTIADPNSLFSQLASQSGLSTADVGLGGSNFISATAAARKKRQTINSDGTINCGTTTGLTTGDILAVEYIITYPEFCLGFCRTRFKANIMTSIKHNNQQFTVTINFTIAGIKTVTLAFCGFFSSNSAGCTTETKNYAYLMDTNSNLYQFNPTNYNVTSLGPINCSTTSLLYSIAVQRNGILWAEFSDGTLFRYNIKSGQCNSTSFVTNQTGFSPFTTTFLKNPNSTSETLYVSDESSALQGLATIDINTLTLTYIGNYSALNTYTSLAGNNDGSLYGLFDTANYTIAQIQSNNAQILAQYPLNISSISNPNYGFTIANGVFFIFEGAGSGTNIHVFDQTTNSTTIVATIPQNIYGATSSSCLGTS